MLLHRRKLQSLLHKKYTLHSKRIMCAVMHIPSHNVENWDAFSCIALFLSSTHLIQGHIGILTLEMESAVLEFY